MQKGCSVRDGPFFPRVLKKHLTGNSDFTKRCFINFFIRKHQLLSKVSELFSGFISIFKPD